MFTFELGEFSRKKATWDALKSKRERGWEWRKKRKEEEEEDEEEEDEEERQERKESEVSSSL